MNTCAYGGEQTREPNNGSAVQLHAACNIQQSPGLLSPKGYICSSPFVQSICRPYAAGYTSMQQAAECQEGPEGSRAMSSCQEQQRSLLYKASQLSSRRCN